MKLFRSQLLRNISYAFTAQGVYFLQSVLISLLVPKVLGVQEFGFWQLFIFYIQYGGFLHFGLEDGIYLQTGGRQYHELDYQALGYQLRVMVIWLIFILSALFFGLGSKAGPDRHFVLLFSCLYVIVFNIFNFYSYISQAVGYIKEYSGARSLVSSAFIIFLIVLLSLRTSDFRPYVIGYVIADTCGVIYFLVRYKEITLQAFNIHSHHLQELIGNIKIGFVLLVSSIMSMLILGYGRFMVDRVWGIETFSVVSYAFVFVNFFLMFINQVGLVLFPDLRRRDETNLNNFYAKSRRFMSLLTPAILLFYIPFYLLLKYWLPSYMESAQYMVFLLPMCMFESRVQMINMTMLKVLKKISSMLVCNLTAMLAGVIMVSISIFVIDDLRAVVVSMFIAIALRYYLTEYFVCRHTGIRYDTVSALVDALIPITFIVLNITMGIGMANIIFALLLAAYLTWSYRRTSTTEIK